MKTLFALVTLCVLVFGWVLVSNQKPPDKRPAMGKWLVTYEAVLTNGGVTHDEIMMTAEKLSVESLASVRDHIRRTRTATNLPVCILSVVKLDE